VTCNSKPRDVCTVDRKGPAKGLAGLTLRFTDAGNVEERVIYSHEPCWGRVPAAMYSAAAYQLAGPTAYIEFYGRFLRVGL